MEALSACTVRVCVCVCVCVCTFETFIHACRAMERSTSFPCLSPSHTNAQTHAQTHTHIYCSEGSFPLSLRVQYNECRTVQWYLAAKKNALKFNDLCRRPWFHWKHLGARGKIYNPLYWRESQWYSYGNPPSLRPCVGGGWRKRKNERARGKETSGCEIPLFPIWSISIWAQW